MNILSGHIVLAQRGPGDEWTNLLFVIVMAVLWLVGGIIKAMKTKAENQQQTRQTPARKPSDQKRGAQQQAPTQRPQRPAAGPPRAAQQAPGAAKKRSTLEEMREAARRFAAEAEQSFKEETPKPKPTPRPPKQTKPSPKPQIYREAKAEIKPVGAPIMQSAGKGKPQDVFAQKPASEKLSDLVSDYADPEKLRKAILHYEILGPPISLRD